MRLYASMLAASVLVAPVLSLAQDHSTERSASSVLRPATTVGWRNYVTVPDGPCGPPMAVQADCYPVCRPCGPLRPVCFLQRVGRMFDCLLPCNLCCRQGCGGGLGHGCILGGRARCSVCCGAPSCGACAPSCVHPCGSVFDTPSCSCGGHSCGCSTPLPGLSDPFQDDPLPIPTPPKPTPQPADVRRVPTQRMRPVSAPARISTANTKPASPYKIVSAPSQRAASTAAATTPAVAAKKPASQSVLRRASAEQTYYEPAPLKVDHTRTAPIVRSQSPETAANYEIPSNPLR